MHRQVTKLHAMLEPAVRALGFELLGVEYIPQGRRSVLRLYIDSEEGVTVEDCGRVSHQVGGVLDVENPIRGSYTLEVSSPGLDRPLFTPEQFERHLGSRVKIRLHTPVNGRRKYSGTITELSDGGVVILVDGEGVMLDWDDIDKVNLESGL